MGTIMEGMAFGTGSAIAHRAVGAIAGSFAGGSAANEQQAAPASVPAPSSSASSLHGQDYCNPFQQEFVSCLQENKSDIAACQMYLDNFNQCKADARLQ
jgi:hypothetical protein